MPIVILFSLATDKKYASIPINSNNNKIGKINLQYLIIVPITSILKRNLKS